MGATVGTEAQIQQSRQIVRATNSLIAQHLATEVSNAFSFTPGLSQQETSLGASSDENNSSPIAFWGTISLSEIHEDNDNVASFDTDIYQFVAGFDKKIGKLFIGTALTYAYGETEQTGQDTTSQVIGVTPYIAYQLTDFMFISGLAGYNYSYIKDENFNNDSDVHDYIIESNLNFYKTFMDSIIVKTRMRARFHHTYVSSTDNPLDATTDELLWLGDLELGYHFQNNLTTYVGTYYEYFDREASTHHFKEHDGILFMRGGFDYPLTHNLTLGGKVQADLTDEDTDIITGSINIRLAM
ncbi:MAG: autotransporter domain-containing protein [Methylococcaceae bacterium]|nr:autotransporter domain-containing protein [Methylococcaceae bacterium]